jgi:chemotaxis protein MotB
MVTNNKLTNISELHSTQSKYGDGLNAPASSKLPHLLNDHHQLRNHLDRWGSPSFDNIEMSPQWSVPWSDLMMVMMVMFAIMFFLQRAERNVGDSFKNEVKNPIKIQHRVSNSFRQPINIKKIPLSAQEILRLSEKLVSQVNLDDVQVVLTENQAVKVSVQGNLLFGLGKVDLKPEATSFLEKLAKIISTNNYQIEVIGHTDNFPISNPSFPTNWELSSARSARVARYLIQAENLDPGRFAIIGRGSYQPVVPNTTPENKSRNRRVEIIITRNEYKS